MKYPYKPVTSKKGKFLSVWGLGLLFVCSSAFSQNYFPQTASMAGMAGTGAHISGSNSVFGNPAGLACDRSVAGFAGFDTRYGVQGMNTLLAGVAMPVGKYGAGAGLYRFGDEYYNEQKISVGVAHKIDFVKLGIGADLLQVSIAEYGTGYKPMINFGGIARPIKHLFFSAYGQNLSRTRLSEVYSRYLPTVLSAALGYEPDSSVTLLVAVNKDLDYDPVYRMGVEYRMRKFLHLRSGFTLQPVAATGGFSFRHSGFVLDYAAGFHPRLGFMHFISLGRFFKSAKDAVGGA